MTKIETSLRIARSGEVPSASAAPVQTAPAPTKLRRGGISFRDGATFDATRHPIRGEIRAGQISSPRGSAAAGLTAPHQSGRGWFARLLADLRASRATRREVRALAMTVRDLDALSDHSLRDIGLLRGSIEATLREHPRYSR